MLGTTHCGAIKLSGCWRWPMPDRKPLHATRERTFTALQPGLFEKKNLKNRSACCASICKPLRIALPTPSRQWFMIGSDGCSRTKMIVKLRYESMKRAEDSTLETKPLKRR